MNVLKPLLLAMLSTLSATAANAAWSVYDYTATVTANTVIDGNSFAAGSQVTGQVFILEGTTPGNDGWGYAGEVARYADTVNSFSVHTAGLDVSATGAGDAVVHNDRRLTRRGDAWQDIFSASLTSEATTRFSSVAMGGGVSSLSFNLATPLAARSTATTSLALPGAVTPALFTQDRTLRVSFASGANLDAQITGMSVSHLNQLAPVPEPASAALLGLGLAGVGLLRRRQRAA